MELKRPGFAVAAASGVLLVLVLAGLILWLTHTEQGLEIQIFDDPVSVCEEYRVKTNSQTVLGVEATTGDGLQRGAASMIAGNLRKIAKIGPPPDGVRARLVLLADQIEEASQSADFSAAAATAAALDADLALRCEE